MDARRFSTALRRGSVFGKVKPKIQITIDGEDENNYVPAFTTGDDIKGCVQIECEAPLKFTEIYITFEGYSKTRIEKQMTGAALTHKEDGYHLIIRLVQPVDESAFPNESVLEPFTPYRFPFHFVVPEQTVPKHCTHPKINLPQDAHMPLPPSLGDADVATYGRTLMDDMCPEMARIVYQIKARVTENLGSEGKYKSLIDSSKKLCVCPAVEVAPPLKVDGGDKDDYCIRQEATVNAGTFRPRIGRVTAEAAQPNSLILPSIREKNPCPVMTTATVNLRFDPAKAKDTPPKVTAVNARIKVATAWGSQPFEGPVAKSSTFYTNYSQSLFVESVPLVNREMANVQWTKQVKSANPSVNDPVDRRSKAPAPSKHYHGDDFYTAKIEVPIELPTGRKLFVPTFNSCLVCRLYLLHINITIAQPKATLKDPNIVLKLPLQIACRPNPDLARRQANATSPTGVAGILPDSDLGPPPQVFAESDHVVPNGNPPNGVQEAPPGPEQPESFADRDEKTPAALQAEAERSASYSDGMHTLARPQQVRLLSAHNRTDSLIFDNEEAAAEDEPPGYQSIAGRWRPRQRERRASSTGR